WHKLPANGREGLVFRSRHVYVASASHIAILDPFTTEQRVMWTHLNRANCTPVQLTESSMTNADVIPVSLSSDSIPSTVTTTSNAGILATAADVIPHQDSRPVAISGRRASVSGEASASFSPAKRRRVDVEGVRPPTARLVSQLAAVSVILFLQKFNYFYELSCSLISLL
ncbi:unnamed protein product, partial [Protopolystoma xenopodis]